MKNFNIKKRLTFCSKTSKAEVTNGFEPLWELLQSSA